MAAFSASQMPAPTSANHTTIGSRRRTLGAVAKVTDVARNATITATVSGHR